MQPCQELLAGSVVVSYRIVVEVAILIHIVDIGPEEPSVDVRST